ncbi:MAG: aldo/keto reductase [Thermofilum sp.]
MEYTILGKTGERVSRIGLGAWQFSEAWGALDFEAAKAVVRRAVELGINFFDTAMVYGNGKSEKLLGRSLKELSVSRDSVIVSTKIPGEFLNPLDIPRAVRKSIENLELGYIDVLLAHWPPAWHNVPTRVYARSLEQLVNMGLVRYLGLSNFPVELVESFRSSLSRCDVEVFQHRYNLLERWAEAEVIPYAEKHRITLQAWSPIAKGALTGKYSPDNLPQFRDVRAREPVFHPENFRKAWPLLQLLSSIAEKYGKKPVQVALNWLILSSPAVVPIPGAKAPEQVDDVAGAVGWRLKTEDWSLLDEASRSVSVSYSVYYTAQE